MTPQVLFVDDDAVTRDLVQAWLGLHGYNVSTASTVSDALKLVQSYSFNIYILDNWLPDGSGIKLCEQLKLLNSEIPILFFSAAAYQSDIVSAVAAGAQAYLTKPIELEDLHYTVERLIKEVEISIAR